MSRCTQPGAGAGSKHLMPGLRCYPLPRTSCQCGPRLCVSSSLAESSARGLSQGPAGPQLRFSFTWISSSQLRRCVLQGMLVHIWRDFGCHHGACCWYLAGGGPGMLQEMVQCIVQPSCGREFSSPYLMLTSPRLRNPDLENYLTSQTLSGRPPFSHTGSAVYRFKTVLQCGSPFLLEQ